MKRTRFLAGLAAAVMAAGLLAGASAEWKEEKKNGKVVRRSWVNEAGAPAVSPEGYATVTLSYSGTTVTEKYLDLAGKPARTVGGYYGRILTYGNKHRLEEIVFLNEKGSPAENIAGFARIKAGYTAAGAVTTAGYYNASKNPTVVPSLGYAQVKNDYRGVVLTKTTYLDAKKNAVDVSLGYAVRIQSVNKNNKITGIRFEHADGSAAACAEGWASMKREIDSKNREVSLKYYDLAGNLTDRGQGWAYEVKNWESDQAYTVSRYDVNNRPIPMGSGYMSLRREMNRNGQVIRETYLDETGAARENTEGIATRKYTYDDSGRLSKVTFEGSRGDVTENSSGYAGYQETVNEDGFLVSRVFLSKGGKPVNTTAGYAEIRYAYDGMGQITATEYYDADGALVRAE